MVAAGGAWWLEAKASLPFGLGSTAWVDLTKQLERLTALQRTSLCGLRRPRLLVVFRHACPAEVHEALLRLGVTPISADADGRLPAPTAVALQIGGASEAALLRPPSVLLDVSTLLCILSSSCRASPDDPRLRAWAAPNEHWSRSLDEEQEAPLLPHLAQLLQRHTPWRARRADVDKCDALVAMAGGGAERARWKALRELLVVMADDSGRSTSDTPSRGEHAAASPSPPGASHDDGMDAEEIAPPAVAFAAEAVIPFG